MKTMATGHREVMVRMPMNGLIQMAVPVISSWERICVFLFLAMVKLEGEAWQDGTYIREVKVAIGPQHHREDGERRLEDCILKSTYFQPEE